MLTEEIKAHLDLLAAEHERRGLSRAAARAAARREFGGVVHMTERHREMRGFAIVDQVLSDLRYAGRTVRRSPGFTLVAVLSLAIGIGGNTTIFTLINAVVLRPLPVAAPRELAFFTTASPTRSGEVFSYPIYEQFRDSTTALSGVAAGGSMTNVQMTASEPGAGTAPETILAERVSGNYFTVLGVTAALGRTFTADDDGPGRPNPVVVLSHGFWRRRFGGDPGVISRTITLARVPFTIIGVAPEGFSGFMVGESPDLWWPMHAIELTAPTNATQPTTLLSQTGSSWLRLIGRLAPGATLDQASAEMDVILQRDLAARGAQRAARLGDQWAAAERTAFFSEHMQLRDGSTGSTPLREDYGTHLVVLMATAGIVLLVACANVANLLLARASSRRREIAVRLAIGAGRARIVRQLLTESLLVSAIGGAAGLLAARWSAELLLTFLPQDAVALDLSPDVRVLSFALAVSALTGLTFGLAPALRATKLNLTADLKQDGALAGARPQRLVLHKLLVVAQVALSVVVLMSAALFARTLANLKGLDAGFDRRNTTLFSLSGTSATSDQAARVELFDRLLSRLELLPEVQSTSLFNFGLLRGNDWTNAVEVPGYTPAPDESLIVDGQQAGPRFFETMGTPVILGRDFTEADMRTPVPEVAVINEAMARRFFGGVNPLGRRFSLRVPSGQQRRPLEVVGVVRDTKYRTLRESTRPAFSVPFPHGTSQTPTVVVRAAGPQPGLPETIRQVVREVDPELQIGWFRTMEGVVAEATTQESFIARLGGAFSALALLLASVGLYGVLSYAVARRTRELGIRMALGAQPGRLQWMILRDDLMLVAMGVTIGVPSAMLAARAVQRLLFGVDAFDAMSLAISITLMTVVAALAGYMPARRAARVDPMAVLRAD